MKKLVFDLRIIMLAIVSAIANNLCALTGNGSQGNPYLINSPSELTSFITLANLNPTLCARVQANIDMNGITGFTPIGTESHPYTGIFDGSNHTISNLHITETTSGNYIGLFGKVGGNAIIKNIRLDSSCSITTNAQYVGGIIGYISSDGITQIENCLSDVSIECNGDNPNVGGIIGTIAGTGSTLVSSCLNNGSITSSSEVSSYSSGIGGVVGFCNANVSLDNCANTGDINSGKQSFVGGINGRISTSNTTAYCRYCVNYGTVNSNIAASKNAAIGGFIGYGGDVNIRYCANAGKIDCTNIVGNRIGAFAGRIGLGAQIKDNYYNSASPYDPVYNDTNSGIIDDFEYGRNIFKDNSYFDCTSSAHYARIKIFLNNTTFNEKTRIKNIEAFIGNNHITNSLNIELEDKTDFVVFERFGAKHISYQRNIGTSTWGTLCLPFAVSSSDDVQFYELSEVTDNNLNMTEVAEVPAYTPTVFKMKNGTSCLSLEAENIIIEPTKGTYTLTCSEPSWQFVGTTKNNKITSGFYIARNQFWNAADKGSEVDFPAYRAIFTTSDTQARGSVFNICIDGITEITSAVTSLNTQINTECNLLGQRVSANTHGIIIKNGRKVVR